MTKVLGLAIVRTHSDLNEPIPLTIANDLSSFGYFQRQFFKETLLALTKTLLKHMEPGQRQSVEERGYVIHCYVRGDGLGGTVATDNTYPARVAYNLLSQLLSDFVRQHGDSWQTVQQPESMVFPKAQEYLQKYQEPTEEDKIMKIQRDLDETKDMVSKNLQDIMGRGVLLEDLLVQSNDLSAQSKLFYKQAKKTNSCCGV